MLSFLIVFVFGLAIGSFVGAYTYRWPREISIKKGRSFCPKCKKKISWVENIPLLSYLFLKGRCRKCHKRISLRYPIIEIATGLAFVATYHAYGQGVSLHVSAEMLTLPYLLVVISSLIVIFIIDLEHQLIPDELVFLLCGVTVVLLILFSPGVLYQSLLVGFCASLFFLALHLITLGRGMGLGDVKLALFGGMFLGYPHTISWIFISFLLGSFVALLMLATGKAKIGKQIAFGPFMIIAFFIVAFWGGEIVYILFPWM